MSKRLLKLVHEACGLKLLWAILISEIKLAALLVTLCTTESAAGSECLGQCDLAALLTKVWGPKAVELEVALVQ